MPPFLCKFIRYLAEVVHDALEEFAGTVLSVALVLAEDGPSIGSIWRWVQPLENPSVGSWLEERLAALCPDWRHRWLAPLEAELPRPSPSRVFAWSTLQKLRSLHRVLSKKAASSPAALLQLARLDLATPFSL